MSDTSTVNDFDAAKAICDQLKGLDKDRQHRILRWVAESLDLVLNGRTAPYEGAAGHKVTVEATHEQGSNTQPLPGRPQDIKTFVESKKPKSDMQFAHGGSLLLSV